MSSFFSLNFGDGTSIRDNSNNELLTFDVNGSATNNLQITNNASGSNVSIDVIGDDTDIGLNLNPKGHGKINVLGSASNAGGIRLYSAGATDDSNHVGLTVSSALDEDITFTLPTSDGTSGQVLQTNGSGALSFTDAGSGTPAGADTQIQFNNSGSFGGISTFTTDGTDLTLTSGTELIFGDAGENIVGDGSDLYVNSSQSLILAPTANVMVGSGVSVDFGNAGENIVGDGSDLYINSSQSLVLAPTSNIMIGNTPIALGDVVTSGATIQHVPASAGLNSNIMIQTIGVDTGLQFISGNVYIVNQHLILAHEIVTSAPTYYWPIYNITLFNLSSGTADTIDVSGNPVAQGASWHVLFDNTGDTSTSLIIDFGSNGLVSGSGLAQNLTFSTTGQSASLIYMAEKWRIINTGATVS